MRIFISNVIVAEIEYRSKLILDNMTDGMSANPLQYPPFPVLMFTPIMPGSAPISAETQQP